MNKQVCIIANQMKGVSRSEAFRKAWTICKIEVLESRRFEIAMIDRQSDDDRLEDCGISRKIRNLRAHGMAEAEKAQARHDAMVAANTARAQEINYHLNMSMVGVIRYTVDGEAYISYERSW